MAKPEFTVKMESWMTEVILSALYRHAGELAAHEMRRTGGKGFASGGVAHQIEQAHRARRQLLYLRIRTYEWRRDHEGACWYISGQDELNYTLRSVLGTDSKATSKTPYHSMRDTQPWHSWPVVAPSAKPYEAPEDFIR